MRKRKVIALILLLALAGCCHPPFYDIYCHHILTKNMPKGEHLACEPVSGSWSYYRADGTEDWDAGRKGLPWGNKCLICE